MPGIYADRLRRFRMLLERKGIEAALVTKRVNFMYLSGFNGTSAVLYITSRRSVLVTDSRYFEQARAQAPDYEVAGYADSRLHELKRLFEADGVRVAAFEDRHLTYAEYEEFSGRLGVREFVPLGPAVEELRRVKDDSEIAIIKKAVDIADSVFNEILALIKPGITEKELADEIDHRMRLLGAQGASFDTIIASGARSSMPHGVASGKKIEAGDAITIDFGAIYNGYCSDITRTVFLGKPAGDLGKIYKIVSEANCIGISAAKRGSTGREADMAARKHIEKAGYGPYFGHGLGHGVGLEIHEDPSLSQRGDLELRDGMVVTVEPGIYIPGLGGARIEDMVVVCGNAPRVLTTATKEMIIL